VGCGHCIFLITTSRKAQQTNHDSVLFLSTTIYFFKGLCVASVLIHQRVITNVLLSVVSTDRTHVGCFNTNALVDTASNASNDTMYFMILGFIYYLLISFNGSVSMTTVVENFCCNMLSFLCNV
jgi:hypothetical protein